MSCLASSDDSDRSSLELTASDQPDLNEISLKERLKKASELDIEPDKISWKNLSIVCRTEHMQDVADDDSAGAIEVQYFPVLPSISVIQCTKFVCFVLARVFLPWLDTCLCLLKSNFCLILYEDS